MNDTTQQNENPLTVLITGANRGLGLEFAKKMAAAGYKVIGTARNPKEASELKEIAAEVLELDVTNNDGIDVFAQQLEGTTIDVLINNSGIFPKSTDRADMLQTYSVNTLGAYFVSEALIENLKKSDSARIVNVSSKLGQLSGGDGSAKGYGFSKTALNMVTRNLHASYSDEGITVISLNPGHNRTDMGGEEAALDPEETAEQVVALIAGLTPEQSGGFWRYDGAKMEW